MATYRKLGGFFSCVAQRIGSFSVFRGLDSVIWGLRSYHTSSSSYDDIMRFSLSANERCLLRFLLCFMIISRMCICGVPPTSPGGLMMYPCPVRRPSHSHQSAPPSKTRNVGRGAAILSRKHYEPPSPGLVVSLRGSKSVPRTPFLFTIYVELSISRQSVDLYIYFF